MTQASSKKKPMIPEAVSAVPNLITIMPHTLF